MGFIHQLFVLVKSWFSEALLIKKQFLPQLHVSSLYLQFSWKMHIIRSFSGTQKFGQWHE